MSYIFPLHHLQIKWDFKPCKINVWISVLFSDIIIGVLEDGVVYDDDVVNVRFFDGEANVAMMAAKVKQQLHLEEEVVLLNAKFQRLMNSADSQGKCTMIIND